MTKRKTRQTKLQASQDRLDWLDPQMPVIRDYKFANGQRKTEVDPDYERRYREHMMTAAEQPKKSEDPTYNLRRKK